MKILRVTPDHFDVLYQINPHMKVGSVDKNQARKQWEDLGKIYTQLGIELIELQGEPSFPDMVFSANQSFPFLGKNGKKGVILSNMASSFRQGEVPFFEHWYLKESYEIFRLDSALKLEGMGDLIYPVGRNYIWAGYGFRTQIEAHREVEKITGLSVRSLRLVDPAFYHLDVCLCVIDEHTVLIYPEAFDAPSLALIREVYPDCIELTRAEAYAFACNAHCPDQKHVLIPIGSPRIEEELRSKGYFVYPVDTSEFLKSGGSVFCLKLDLE